MLERGARGEPGLAFEFKIDKNKLAPEQLRWFEQLRQRGWCCAEARSADEFHNVLSSYLGRWLPPVGSEVVALE